MGAQTFLCCSWTLALSHPKVQQERCGAPLSLDPWVIPGSKQSHGIWFDTKHWHPKKLPDQGRQQCCPLSQKPAPCQGKGQWKWSNINPEGGFGTRNWHTRIPRWILTCHKGGRAGSWLPQHTTTKTTQGTVSEPSPPFAHLCSRQGCAGCTEAVLSPSPEL